MHFSLVLVGEMVTVSEGSRTAIFRSRFVLVVFGLLVESARLVSNWFDVGLVIWGRVVVSMVLVVVSPILISFVRLEMIVAHLWCEQRNRMIRMGRSCCMQQIGRVSS